MTIEYIITYLTVLFILRYHIAEAFGLNIDAEFDNDGDGIPDVVVLEEHLISLDQERNDRDYFDYIELNTQISSSWENLPLKSDIINKKSPFNEVEECKVPFKMYLLNYEKDKGTICMFKDSKDSTAFENEATTIQLGKEKITQDKFFGALYPVTGYIVGEKLSLVAGYLINGFFYGTLRLFDKFRMHFIIYYVEPIGNLKFYTSLQTAAPSIISPILTKPANAILFEYIAHDEDELLSVDPDKGTVDPDNFPEISTTTDAGNIYLTTTALPSSNSSNVSVSVSTEPSTTTIVSTVTTPIIHLFSTTIVNHIHSTTLTAIPYVYNHYHSTVNVPKSTALTQSTTFSSTSQQSTNTTSTPITPTHYHSTTLQSSQVNTTVHPPTTTNSTAFTNISTTIPSMTSTPVIPTHYHSTTLQSSQVNTTGHPTTTTNSTAFTNISTTVQSMTSTPVIPTHHHSTTLHSSQVNITGHPTSTTNSTGSTTISALRTNNSSITPRTEVNQTSRISKTRGRTFLNTVIDSPTLVNVDQSFNQNVPINQFLILGSDAFGTGKGHGSHTSEEIDCKCESSTKSSSITGNQTGSATGKGSNFRNDNSTFNQYNFFLLGFGDLLNGSKPEIVSSLPLNSTTEPSSSTSMGPSHSTHITSESPKNLTSTITTEEPTTSTSEPPKNLTSTTEAPTTSTPSTTKVPQIFHSTTENLIPIIYKSTTVETTPNNYHSSTINAVTTAIYHSTTELETVQPYHSSTAINLVTFPYHSTTELNIEPPYHSSTEIVQVIPPYHSTTELDIEPPYHSSTAINSVVPPFHSTTELDIEPPYHSSTAINSVVPPYHSTTELDIESPFHSTEIEVPITTTPIITTTDTAVPTRRTRKPVNPIQTITDEVDDRTHQGKKRRKRDVIDLQEPGDVVEFIDFKTGASNSDVFDLRRDKAFYCNLCIWIQPHFASKFSLGGRLEIGISEIIETIKFLAWIFRVLDFNFDTLPDAVAFIIKDIIVEDIKFPITNPSNSADETSSFSNGQNHITFSTAIGTISPDEVLPVIEKELSNKFSSSCCAVLGFIYHDIPSMLSITNLRGLCTEKNVAVVTGYQHDHKISRFDIYRATFHAMAHLFGANHDQRYDSDCFDTTVDPFLNPFPMEPDHQLNVGIRPNSMRISYCTKFQIAVFMSSNSPSCLISKKEKYCGNGIQDDDEECDCGAPWQCVLREQCCGMRDSFSPCKIIKPSKNGKCHRPYDW